MTVKSKIAIFASGGGTNAEEILKHFQHHSSVEVVLLLSNNAQAYALDRAKKFNIDTRSFTKQQYRESEVVLEWLKEKGVTHIVLAGFLWLVPEYLIKAFPHCIVNIHPALLPKFGGKGMYGMNVHEAVKQKGETETGITIHEVNDKYDDGKILFQANCSVDSFDTSNDIAHKVHALEHKYYPQVIDKWITNKLISNI